MSLILNEKKYNEIAITGKTYEEYNKNHPEYTDFYNFLKWITVRYPETKIKGVELIQGRIYPIPDFDTYPYAVQIVYYDTENTQRLPHPNENFFKLYSEVNPKWLQRQAIIENFIYDVMEHVRVESKDVFSPIYGCNKIHIITKNYDLMYTDQWWKRGVAIEKQRGYGVDYVDMNERVR